MRSVFLVVAFSLADGNFLQLLGKLGILCPPSLALADEFWERLKKLLLLCECLEHKRLIIDGPNGFEIAEVDLAREIARTRDGSNDGTDSKGAGMFEGPLSRDQAF